ncbi:hypothetical protein CHS0354_024417 [Potamilus streckersoni]|uniref:Uncharacterized protein n=1 Tax=Potamilus streckersoni TaxID=2493646 RepID=A0AAE0SWA7_9BIVA|nr:hypothetical protein CHS0354_024417 [Potamilus streckersoni]
MGTQSDPYASPAWECEANRTQTATRNYDRNRTIVRDCSFLPFSIPAFPPYMLETHCNTDDDT